MNLTGAIIKQLPWWAVLLFFLALILTGIIALWWLSLTTPSFVA